MFKNLFMRLLLKILFLLQILPCTLAQQRDLEYFVNQAISNSPLLKDFQNQIQANQIDSMRIQAGFGPQVNVVSNNYYSPIFNGWGQDEVITNIANVSALAAVSKEIVGNKNKNNQYWIVRLQSMALLNSSKISEQDLKKNVTEQYIITFGFWQQTQYSSEVLTLLQQEEQILKKLTEQGTYKQVDYLSFLVSIQQQKLQLAQENSKYRDNYALLNYLCGINDTAYFHLVEPQLSISDLPELNNSVLYQQFVIDSLKNAANDKQIDFQYKPKINLFSDAGYNSSLVYKPIRNFGVTIGLNFTMPIYDGKQRKMQHNKIAIAEQTRINYRDFFTKQYNQQVYRLFDQLRANNNLAQITEKQITFSKTLIDANHKLLETGDIHITDYIIAIGNYLNAKNTMTQNLVDKNLIVNQINYLNRKK